MRKSLVFSFLATAVLAVLMGVLACSVQQTVNSGSSDVAGEGSVPVSMAVITSPNLLPEPSFEDTNWVSYVGSPYWKMNWLVYTAGILHLTGIHACTGNFGIYMYTANTSARDLVWLNTSNKIVFTPGKAAVATVWIPKLSAYTNSLPAGHFFIQVDFLTVQGLTNGTCRKTFNAAEMLAVTSELKTNKLGNPWKMLTMETPASPGNTAYAVLKLGLEKTNTTTNRQLTLTLDDAALYEADGEAPTNTNKAPVMTSTAVTQVAFGTVYEYDVNATDPEGQAITYSLMIKPIGMSIQSSSGLITWSPTSVQIGSHTVKVLAADSQGGIAEQTWTLTVTGSANAEQTPWKNNQNGNLSVNIGWNYSMGYDFTPLRDGQITRLGAYVNGTKKVKLWLKSTKTALAEVMIPATNNWNFASISPVNVKANTTYTVSVYLAGSGGSVRSSIKTLPQSYGDIVISNSCYSSGDAFPTAVTTTAMYGQVDICFIGTGTIPTNNYPRLTSTPGTRATAGSMYEYDANATDPDGDPLVFSLLSGPSGMTVNPSNGVIWWSPQFTQTGNFPVSVGVSDGKGGSAVQNFTISVSAPASYVQTPWKNNEHGSLITNYPIVVTAGYHFTPMKNGTITKFGGKFKGTFLVILCNKTTGVQLARTNITANNSWVYVSIPPVAVQAGTNYTIVVNTYTTNNMITGRAGTRNFPQVYGDIRIDGGGFYAGAVIPTYTYVNWLYGMPDIEFVPN